MSEKNNLKYIHLLYKNVFDYYNQMKKIALNEKSDSEKEDKTIQDGIHGDPKILPPRDDRRNKKDNLLVKDKDIKRPSDDKDLKRGRY